MGLFEQIEYSLSLIGSRQSASTRIFISLLLFIIVSIIIYILYINIVVPNLPEKVSYLRSQIMGILFAITAGISCAMQYLTLPIKQARDKIERLLNDLPDLLDMFSARQNITISDMVREAADPSRYGIAGRVFELIKREMEKGYSFENAITRIANKLKIREFNIVRDILVSIYRDAGSDSEVVSDTLAFAANMFRMHNIQRDLRKASLGIMKTMILVGQGVLLPSTSGLAIALIAKMGTTLGMALDLTSVANTLLVFMMFNALAASLAVGVISAKSKDEVFTSALVNLPMFIALNMLSFVVGIIVSI